MTTEIKCLIYLPLQIIPNAYLEHRQVRVRLPHLRQLPLALRRLKVQHQSALRQQQQYPPALPQAVRRPLLVFQVPVTATLSAPMH